MTYQPKKYLAFLVLASFCAGAAFAQTTQEFEFSLGYQWVDTSGNEDMYRSQVDQRDGVVLGSFTLLMVDTSGKASLFDRIRIDASNVGSASPFSTFRLQALRRDAVDIRFTWHRAEHFSALPRYANPFIYDTDPFGSQPVVSPDSTLVIPGEHTLDRTSNSYDLDISILPGHVITPIVGYSRETYSGPGTTTYFVGQDEFRMRSDVDETIDELRAGLGFHWGTFAGTLLQGWQRYTSHESVQLAPGAGGGNNAKPVLGTDVTLDSYSRSSRVDNDTPITRGYVAGTIGSRVRVMGSFVRADVDSDGSESETLSGDLVSFPLRRFFTGLSERTTFSSDNPFWRGTARAQVELAAGLDFTAGYSRRHRELDGRSMIEGLYSGITTFEGIDPADISEVVAARTALERDDDIYEARLDWHNAGFRAWAGWQGDDQDVTITQSAAEVVVPGGQGGRFERSIDRYRIGAGYRAHGFDASLEWWNDSADDAIVRTDLLDRTTWRLKAGWGDGKLFKILGTAEKTDGDTGKTGINYDYGSKQYGIELDVTPTEKLSGRVAYSIFRTDTSMNVVRPETLTETLSYYKEDGDLLEAEVDWDAEPLHFGLGYSWFNNDGALPLKLDHGWLRAGFPITGKFGGLVSFDYHDYTEDYFSLADFTAKRYGFFLTWKQ